MKNVEEVLNLKEIGSRVRNEREFLGLSREKLAEIVNLSTFYIGQIERGDRAMSLTTLVRLSNSLGRSTDYILKGKEYNLENIKIYESIDSYLDEDYINEFDDFLLLIKKLPLEKINLLNDLIKLLIPHIK